MWNKPLYRSFGFRKPHLISGELQLIGRFAQCCWLSLAFLFIASLAVAETPCVNGATRGVPASSDLAATDRQAILRQIQESRYVMRTVSAENEDSRWIASNHHQAMTMEFSVDRVAVHQAAVNEAQLGLRLRRYGYAGALQSVAAAEEIVATGRRGEYRRGDLIEWYENSDAGLEQGFTLV